MQGENKRCQGICKLRTRDVKITSLETNQIVRKTSCDFGCSSLFTKMADSDRQPEISETPKKRRKIGRKWEISRDQRLSQHTMGPPCNCSRLRCFEVTSYQERRPLIEHFNSLPSKDQQDSLLSTLIVVNTVKQRRPRQEENDALFHSYSYSYKINVVRDNGAVSVPVCFNAFLSVYGVTKARVERIRASLAKTGVPPIDQRGRHGNHTRAFTDEKVQRIIDHIRSFRGRKSHYSLHDSQRLYLPDDLNLVKMHTMYQEMYPDDPCSRESYRKIFLEKFNISFGYPRKDNCSTCDSLSCKLQVEGLSVEDVARLNGEKQLHLRKATVFYERKARARQLARCDVTKAAVAFDFQKNLSCPNIATNDVYYRRQLSLYTFNVHRLDDDAVHLFTYDETVGKKGADDVASMLALYFEKYLPAEVTHLELFCDSCAGQNKNWTILRFIHHLVVHQKRFQQVKITFPIRGHSYLECDRDMACMNQKKAAETPEGWFEEYETCRTKPSPFNVVKMSSASFKTYTEHIRHLYKAACPVPTRPLREIYFTQDHPRLMSYRDSWNGPYDTAVLSKPVSKRAAEKQAPLAPSYPTALSISEAKFKDLQVLKRFCSPAAQAFFSNLPHAGAESLQQDSDSESELSATED